MKLSGPLFAAVLVTCLNTTHSSAQSGGQHRSGEQPESYHKHHDTRYGHDHLYPDRGAIVHDLPRGTIGINYADVSYRYHDGIWLETRGSAFVVVAPPIGIIVPTLPTFSTVLAQGGETYLYANETYYRPRPDLGGYEVVNEPAERPSQAGPDALVGGQLSGATPALGAPSKLVTPSAMRVSATTPAPVTAPVPVTVPAGSASAPPSAPPKVSTVFLYPQNGQTPDQQARDRYECYLFAVEQSGFDPTRSGGAASSAAGNEPQSDYERAQGACFEARGYVSR